MARYYVGAIWWKKSLSRGGGGERGGEGGGGFFSSNCAIISSHFLTFLLDTLKNTLDYRETKSKKSKKCPVL